MTLSEIVELVAEETGSERHVVWGFVRSFMDVLVDELDRGNEVKIRGLGSFKWSFVQPCLVPGKKVPGGWKLKFFPAKNFRTRRLIMSDDEGMTKYGVVLDDEKEKTANEKSEVRICPVCAEELDDAGACPKHGTQPLEPGGK
jgi:hypothetical protein